MKTPRFWIVRRDDGRLIRRCDTLKDAYRVRKDLESRFNPKYAIVKESDIDITRLMAAGVTG